MKFCTKKDIKVMTGIMAAALLLGGCTNVVTPAGGQLVDDPAIKAEIDLDKVSEAKYDTALMDAEYRRYSMDLFNQTLKDNGGENNVMISPASIMIALDMVAAGAKGESLDQLTNLFAKGQGPLDQQAYAAAMMDKINGAKDVDFSCANAAWNNEKLLGNKVNMNYVDYIRKTFLAEYTVTPFDEKTPDEINKWVDQKTNHMIPKIIDELDPLTVMVLVNAIAFDAKWDEAYTEDQIQPGKFHRTDGSEQDAEFLNSKESVYFETDKATGFMKDYKGGKYAFLAILPKDDSISANEFAKNFTSADYEAFIKSVEKGGTVFAKMPEFKSDYGFLVNNTLMNLGVTDVFSDATADLSGIAGQPHDIYVSKVIHMTHIEVDRQGTKAAAATAIALNQKSAEPEPMDYKVVHCDRPFVYAIVDTETMAPVFIGTVNEV